LVRKIKNISKIKKEMIDEKMQEGDESIMQNEESLENLEGYEILL
jgi:hypothetical protein